MADTIADKIQNKKDLITAAYSKCNEKGAALPELQNIANLAECINTIELPPVYTGEYNITSNKELEVAGMKMKSNLTVDVPVPSGYIKIADTKIYVTQKPKIAAYIPNTDKLISATTIPIGFKPKIFIIRCHSGIAPSSTSYCVSSFFVLDNDYNSFSESVAEYSSTSKVYSFATTTIGSSTASTSQSTKNVFHPYDNGVQGSDTSTIYMKKGATYLYYAWG